MTSPLGTPNWRKWWPTQPAEEVQARCIQTVERALKGEPSEDFKAALTLVENQARGALKELLVSEATGEPLLRLQTAANQAMACLELLTALTPEVPANHAKDAK